LVAANSGHAQVVRLLLEAKADLSVSVDYQGQQYTALSFAKAKHYVDVEAVLKQFGAVDLDF